MTHLIVLALGLATCVGGITACVLLAGRDHRRRQRAQRLAGHHTAEYHQSLYTHTREENR